MKTEGKGEGELTRGGAEADFEHLSWNEEAASATKRRQLKTKRWCQRRGEAAHIPSSFWWWNEGRFHNISVLDSVSVYFFPVTSAEPGLWSGSSYGCHVPEQCGAVDDVVGGGLQTVHAVPLLRHWRALLLSVGPQVSGQSRLRNDCPRLAPPPHWMQSTKNHYSHLNSHHVWGLNHLSLRRAEAPKSLSSSATSPDLQPALQCLPPQALSCGLWVLQSHSMVLGGPASNPHLCTPQNQTACVLSQVKANSLFLFFFLYSDDFSNCCYLISVPPPSPFSELIRTLDGGQISLDWVDNQTSTTYPESSTRPTVLLLPGLTGNSQQSYVRHAVTQATRHGYRSADPLTCGGWNADAAFTRCLLLFWFGLDVWCSTTEEFQGRSCW